jgi:cytochrome c-type biogenesis protein
MNVEPTIGLALLAGFVSFISPCVLPLVPAYVGYMGGQATTAATEKRGQFTTFLHGIFFVLGFTIFFVGFGLLTAAASQTLTRIGINIPTILTRLGGVAVILFGLYVMKALDPVFRRGLSFTSRLRQNFNLALIFSAVVGGVLLVYFLWVFDFFAEPSPIAIVLPLVLLLILLALFRKSMQGATSLGDFWYRAIEQLQVALITDTRNLEIKSGGGYLGSLGIGLVFAAGWTPCIGPIYGSVLTLAADSAANGESLLPAGKLLAAYSLGLGIPFLVTAFALNQMTGVMRGLKRNMRKIEYASGSLLLLIGVLILSGSLAQLSARFSSGGSLGDFSVRLEACTIGVAEGRIQTSSWRGCVGDGMEKLNDRIAFAAARPRAAQGGESTSSVPVLTAANPPTAGNTDRLFTVDPNFDPNMVEEGTAVGKRAPDFSTVTPDGKPISLSDFRGDIVLLNFWATWCGPCGKEMPEFETIYQEYKDRGFTVLAVDFLETPEAVATFVDNLGLTFPIGMDESGEINDDLYGVGQYPTSFVIDGHGIIIAVQAGPFLGEELVAILESFETDTPAAGG